MAEANKENWFKRTWGKVCKYFRELKNAAIVVACVICVGVFIWLFDFVAQVGIDALIGVFH